jgi:ferric iron reductase protein FhuF
MWTNAAEWVSMVSNAADEYLGPERAAPFVEDRIALFSADTLPGVPGPNPLRDLIEWDAYVADDFPRGVERRRICCMTYMLSDRLGRLCSNCPFLSVDERVAMVREEHGHPMGSPGGPAQRRAIEVGLGKLGLPAC